MAIGQNVFFLDDTRGLRSHRLRPGGPLSLYRDPIGTRHELLAVLHPEDPERLELKLLRTLSPIAHGQRYRAHPFLGPDRQWLFFADVIDGFSQVCAIDVRDLVDQDVF